ncbi:glutamine-hydrolyzing GMP synthase [Lentzea sp. BCCO 10_0061]|uniref:GMP synthase (glutamine-hydrolyzing) n=1 Tax=Lentzea sokolovensis TaxID=3095429 RepID=A0ABU4VDM0_9PSEU|nr:glutamine-hydrolyzing GMP synthase [Lentzea sp. BCCO 10_0061]MDX8149891.1 glutamine-hydrolyzing GMP synthase [Lentzea sp. BCCO 10_0061]
MRIVILDCGSQYTQLIRRVLDESGVATSVVDGDVFADELAARYGTNGIAGVVISGGSGSITGDYVQIDPAWLQLNIPMLGICFGYQWLAQKFGSTVSTTSHGFAGERLAVLRANQLISSSQDGTTVWMSHRDSVTSLGSELVPIACTPESTVAAFQHESLAVYGVQFHPEVSHSDIGAEILRAFAKICEVSMRPTPWSPEKFVDETIPQLRGAVGSDRVLLALSGGVDSSSLCALLARAMQPDQLLAVYIDSGLMQEETSKLTSELCKRLGVSYVEWDAATRFFSALNVVKDPTEKCLVVGKIFASELTAVAQLHNCRFVAQGTIWSDVIESGGTKFSSQIKPHHNVAGMPEVLSFELLEPLRSLFKDQVRQLASHLGLPKEYSARRVFPGPGFAIRVKGLVTPKKVAVVRRASQIVEEVLDQQGLGPSIWMAFAVLLEVDSLGVQGDHRVENRWALVVRIVESTNSMTARFSRSAYGALEEIASRLVHETVVGRVVYDITDKPPATIEWE